MSSNIEDQAGMPGEIPGPASGIGATLRAARERTGKDLSEVATLLRIRQPFLQALEDGRHKDLPGGTYAVGFLRTYAEFLQLDGEEMVRRFRAEAAGELDARSELVFPSPVSEGRIPGGAVLFLGVVLAGIAYGGWYFLSSRDADMAEMVPALPERLTTVLNRQATLTGEPAAKATAPAQPKAEEPAAPKPDEPVASPVQPVKEEVVPPPESEEPATAQPGKPEPVVETAKVEPAKPEPAKVEPAKPEPAKPEPAKVEPAPVTPPEAVAGKVIGEENADSRIRLVAAQDDCWVQVRELDGQLLLSRLLRKGDSYLVPNRPGLTLMVGNAGALEVTVDGRKAPALGASGQVRRDIKLEADKLLAGG